MNRKPQRWPLALIAAPAAVAVWSGWVGLGGLSGFGEIRPLPGIVSWHLNTAITLPVGVEAYGAYALWTWLGSSAASESTRRFAQRSALGSPALGCLGQIAYHLLAAAGATRAPDFVVVLVACIPVIVVGLAAALMHMTQADAKTAEQADAEARQKEAGRAAARAAKTASGVAEATPKPTAPDTANPPEQPAKPLSPTAAKRARATDLLTANRSMTTADVKAQSGASENTILRIRKELAADAAEDEEGAKRDSGVVLRAVE